MTDENPYETARKNLPSVAKHKREQLRLEANAYAEGQQNPDPKQYAKREELVEAILERRHHGHSYDVIHFNEVAKIVRTHGLEE